MSSMEAKGDTLSPELPHHELVPQQKEEWSSLKHQEAELQNCQQSAHSGFGRQNVIIKAARQLTPEEKKYWKKHLPDGFEFYLKHLARSVIRHQPKNVVEFAAKYLKKILAIRNFELSKLPTESYLIKLCKKKNLECARKCQNCETAYGPAISQNVAVVSLENCPAADPGSIDHKPCVSDFTVRPKVRCNLAQCGVKLVDLEKLSENNNPNARREVEMSVQSNCEFGANSLWPAQQAENYITLPGHFVPAINDTVDLYISRSYPIQGALHETKYYQNEPLAKGKHPGSDCLQTTNSNKMANHYADSCLWQPSILHSMSELMGARGDQFKDNAALDISLQWEHEQDKISFAGTEGKISNEAASGCEVDHILPAWTEKPVETHSPSPRVSREHIKNDDNLIPDSVKSFITKKSIQTDEDSIGEDIQARFRVEQNTYFIPIRSYSEMMQASWYLAQENEIGNQGEYVDGQAFTLGGDMACQAAVLGEDTDGQAFELGDYTDGQVIALGEYMDGQDLIQENIEHICSFKNVYKPHCNVCKPYGKEQFPDEGNLQWEEPPPRMNVRKSDTFLEYKHGKMDDMTFCCGGREVDASAFRNMKMTASTSIEQLSSISNIGHQLSTHFCGERHTHPSVEAYGYPTLNEDLNAEAFPPREYPTKGSFKNVCKPHCNHCNVCKPHGKEQFPDEGNLEWEEPPPRMHVRKSDTFLEYRHGRMEDMMFCCGGREVDASAFRNMKMTASTNIKQLNNNSNIGHQLSTHFNGERHTHPSVEAYGYQTLNEDLNAKAFLPWEYPTKGNVEFHFRASNNMNNNGNTASTITSSQARIQETLPFSKVVREGAIIPEKEPVQKRASVEFVLFEGNEVFSIPKEAIVANTWMNYYTPSKKEPSLNPEAESNSDLVNVIMNQTVPEQEMINNCLNQRTPNPKLLNIKQKQRALKWKVLEEHSKGTFSNSLGCVTKQCSSLAAAKPGKLKLQHMASRKEPVDEMKARKALPVTAIQNKITGASKVCKRMTSPKFSATRRCSKCSPQFSKSKTCSLKSPKLRTCSPKSPKLRTCSPQSPKLRTCSPQSPKLITCSPLSSKSKTCSPQPSRSKTCSLKSQKLITFNPKVPKLSTCSPKPPKQRSFSPKLSKPKTMSPQSSKIRMSSPKSPMFKNCNPKSPKIRPSSPKSPKMRTSSLSSLKIRRSSPKSANIRTFSPKSSGSKTFCPKTKTRYCNSRIQHQQRLNSTVNASASGDHENVRPKKKFDYHDHKGAKYIFHPSGISFNVKKAKSQTMVNKSPSPKMASSTNSSSEIKKVQENTTRKAQIRTRKDNSAFPVSLHTFYDPCTVASCYMPETTRQLTIENPKENLMVYTTYVRPNPFQPNPRGIFGLISQKHRLYLEDSERMASSDQTRQLICETECFVMKDPVTKNLIIENGTVNEPTPKVARSASALKSKVKSLSGSKSEMSNTSKTSTTGKSKPKKPSWVDLQYVELIDDFVYIGRQKVENAQKITAADGNKNSNAHCKALCEEEQCRSSYLVDTLDMDDCFFPQAVKDGAGPSVGSNISTYSPLTELQQSPSHKEDPLSFSTKYSDFPDATNWHLDLQCNRNNNSVELSSDMEDATLHDIDQIITEHPQLNSVKHKKRRSRPNSPMKRSLKGKCPECEPRIPGDAEDKQFIDFEHQVQSTDIEVSDEVQTGSSLCLRSNLLPLRNKEIKRGHKLWNPCYCESPRPHLPVQYAECAIQLNLDDICCSEASQYGDVLEKTYTGHVLDIDYITACDCQFKSKATKKRHFDMQVCPEDICPSLKVQTGSSLLLLEPFVKGAVQDVNSHEKQGHPYKADTCEAPLSPHFLESDFVETHEVETQVTATDINPCTDAQTGDSLMLTEPFPPIKPTVSEEEYPEEDATWGDLSIQDMISENKSIYAYYKKYEDLTKLEKDYEMYARPYIKAADSQQPAFQTKEPTEAQMNMNGYFGKEAQYEISVDPSFGRQSSSKRFNQPNDLDNYQENDDVRDHEQGEFRGVSRERESMTVTSYKMETTSDPQLLGSWNPKYKLHLPQQAVLPEDESLYADNEDEIAKFEESQESHRPYKRRRKATHGPSIETQTFKSTERVDEPV